MMQVKKPILLERRTRCLGRLFLAFVLSGSIMLLLAVEAGAQRPQGNAHPAGEGPYTERVAGTVVEFEMIPIPGATVEVTGPGGDRRVLEVGPFWIGRTEVTWDLYDLFVLGRGAAPAQDRFGEEGVSRPSRPYMVPGESFGHSGNPALGMSYLAASTFTAWLSDQTGHSYRLPSEAEWEYVCRGGSGEPSDLRTHAWIAENAGGRTHRVGTRAPNAFGVHDMLGNTGEWVTTEDGEPVVKGGAYRDPAGEVSCVTRRAWEPRWQMTDPQLPRSRWWLSDAPFVGLRVVRVP